MILALRMAYSIIITECVHRGERVLTQLTQLLSQLDDLCCCSLSLRVNCVLHNQDIREIFYSNVPGLNQTIHCFFFNVCVFVGLVGEFEFFRYGQYQPYQSTNQVAISNLHTSSRLSNLQSEGFPKLAGMENFNSGNGRCKHVNSKLLKSVRIYQDCICQQFWESFLYLIFPAFQLLQITRNKKVIFDVIICKDSIGCDDFLGKLQISCIVRKS